MSQAGSFVFVTAHQFGQRALEGILSADEFLDGRLVCKGVFTLPAEHRAKTVGFTDIADLCAGAGLPLHPVGSGTLAGERELIGDLAPHYLLVIGWSRLVPPDVLGIPRARWGGSGDGSSSGPYSSRDHGCIGMHPSPLPTGRGQAPLPWTIIRGLTDTALSTFFLTDSADAGPLIRQQPLRVRPAETATTLFLRMADLHYHAGLLLAPQLAARDVPATEQDDSAATVWPKRRPADSELSLHQSWDEADRFVRALAWPYPRAYLSIDGLTYQVERCEPWRPAGSDDDDRPRICSVAGDTVVVRFLDRYAALRVSRVPGSAAQ